MIFNTIIFIIIAVFLIFGFESCYKGILVLKTYVLQYTLFGNGCSLSQGDTHTGYNQECW